MSTSVDIWQLLITSVNFFLSFTCNHIKTIVELYVKECLIYGFKEILINGTDVDFSLNKMIGDWLQHIANGVVASLAFCTVRFVQVHNSIIIINNAAAFSCNILINDAPKRYQINIKPL